MHAAFLSEQALSILERDEFDWNVRQSKLCSADWQSAVSPNGIRRRTATALTTEFLAA
jgi:hypothetical protein